MPYDLPILPNLPGLGTGESNYGSAPYAEAQARAQLRLGLRDRLLAGLSGLGGVHPGMNFGQAFLAAAGGSARATWAAKQAAMNYAQRQTDQEIHRQQAETYRMQTEAALKEKPPKPPPEPYSKAPWYEDPRYADTPGAKAAREKATHIPTKTPKAPVAPKPPKPTPTRIPARLHKTEGDLLREIQWEPKTPKEVSALPQFIQHLTDIMTGRAEADSPALRRAAQMRLNQIHSQGR